MTNTYYHKKKWKLGELHSSSDHEGRWKNWDGEEDHQCPDSSRVDLPVMIQMLISAPACLPILSWHHTSKHNALLTQVFEVGNVQKRGPDNIQSRQYGIRGIGTKSEADDEEQGC